MYTSQEPAIPPSAVALLARTRPWVRLIAVLAFVYSAILVLSALAGVVLDRGPLSARQSLLPMLGLLLFSLVYVPPAILLWRYARHIGRLEVALDEGVRRQALDDALRSQKGFWVYVGVALLLVGGSLLALVVGSIVSGMLSSR